MLKKRDAPEDYCVINSDPSHRLSHFERLTLTGGSELERAMSWIAKQFVSISLEHDIGPIDLKAFKDSENFYGTLARSPNPYSFFPHPLGLPVVKETVVHGLKDGVVLDVEFESGYTAQFPGFAEEYAKESANRTVHARMWKHNDVARPTLIAIHGWTMGDQRINSIAFLPGMLYRQGHNVVLFELPFHGRRAGDGGTNELFPSTDIKTTNEALAQSIWDLRSLAKYLRSQGAAKVGWIGVSLGAYVGALWSGLDSLDVAIPVVPLVSMPEVAWVVIARHPKLQELIEQGLTFKLVEEVYRIHSPLRYGPATNPSNTLIIGGLGDKMVPARQVKQLIKHWPGARVKWFRGGHAAALKKTNAFKEIIKFLNEKMGSASSVIP